MSDFYKKSNILVLGLAHGVSDGAAGLLLGSLAHTMPTWQIGLLVLLYNALAFGGQPVAGLLADHLRQPKMAAVAGLLVMCAALGVATGSRRWASGWPAWGRRCSTWVAGRWRCAPPPNARPGRGSSPHLA